VFADVKYSFLVLVKLIGFSTNTVPMWDANALTSFKLPDIITVKQDHLAILTV
jgi:hypothetical protein